MRTIITLSVCCLNILLLQAQQATDTIQEKRDTIQKVAEPVQQVPESMKRRFEGDYPDATRAVWKADNDWYRVTYFDSLNIEQTIVFDKSGKMEKRFHALSAGLVPSVITDYMNRNYPGKAAYTIYRQTDPAGKVEHFVIHEKQVIYFDREGKFDRKESVDDIKKQQQSDKPWDK